MGTYGQGSGGRLPGGQPRRAAGAGTVYPAGGARSFAGYEPPRVFQDRYSFTIQAGVPGVQCVRIRWQGAHRRAGEGRGADPRAAAGKGQAAILRRRAGASGLYQADGAAAVHAETSANPASGFAACCRGGRNGRGEQAPLAQAA
ncbi:hypothetical protein SDC9_186288 [bioreactor metagenome]|uniref:Uncharacterized protein n=1 Tax=bioreactor metagenome TaxID=1076179 RepID=A0A645HTQ8_9ZZZZ